MDREAIVSSALSAFVERLRARDVQGALALFEGHAPGLRGGGERARARRPSGVLRADLPPSAHLRVDVGRDDSRRRGRGDLVRGAGGGRGATG